jgi:hypothetical protein
MYYQRKGAQAPPFIGVHGHNSGAGLCICRAASLWQWLMRILGCQAVTAGPKPGPSLLDIRRMKAAKGVTGATPKSAASPALPTSACLASCSLALQHGHDWSASARILCSMGLVTLAIQVMCYVSPQSCALPAERRACCTQPQMSSVKSLPYRSFNPQ